MSSSRDGRSRLGTTLIALGGVAVLAIAGVVWFMSRPVSPEGEPQLAAPADEALSAPAPPDPAETAVAARPSATPQPEVVPSVNDAPSAAPSASAEPPRPATQARPSVVAQPKAAAKPTAKPTSTATNDAESMLKYRK